MINLCDKPFIFAVSRVVGHGLFGWATSKQLLPTNCKHTEKQIEICCYGITTVGSKCDHSPFRVGGPHSIEIVSLWSDCISLQHFIINVLQNKNQVVHRLNCDLIVDFLKKGFVMVFPKLLCCEPGASHSIGLRSLHS